LVDSGDRIGGKRGRDDIDDLFKKKGDVSGIKSHKNMVCFFFNISTYIVLKTFRIMQRQSSRAQNRRRNQLNLLNRV
jgi:hypothetical protein